MELLGAAVKSADGDMDGLVAKARQQEYLLESANMFLDAQQRIRNENGARMREQLQLEEKITEELGAAGVAALKLAGVDINSGISEAAKSAAILAGNLGISLNAALSLQNLQGSLEYSGRGEDPRDFGSGYVPPVLPDSMTGRGGGGAKVDQYAADLEALKTSLMTEREVLEQWKLEQDTLLADQRAIELLGIEEHNQAKLRLEEEYTERLAEINGGYHGAALDQAQTFFGDMATAMQSGNDKMVAAAQAFAYIEALINAYRAYNQVIADPSLPWFAKIPAAVGVLGAGLKTVQSIKSLGGSASASAGGTSSAAGVTATSSAAEVAPQTQTVIQLEGTMAEVVGPMLDAIIKGIQSESDDGVIITGIQTA